MELYVVNGRQIYVFQIVNILIIPVRAEQNLV
jgi:hypothetical protein